MREPRIELVQIEGTKAMDEEHMEPDKVGWKEHYNNGIRHTASPSKR